MFRVFSNNPRPLVVLEDWIRSKEYQRTHGGPLVIVDEKGRVALDKNGKPKPFRLVIVGLGGGIAGVVSAGMFEVLQEEGYNDDPIGLFPISAAVPNALAFGCKKSHLVRPFYEDLVRRKFVRFFTRGDARIRLHDDVIIPMLEILDHEALRIYKSSIYTAVTEWESGKGSVVRLKVEEGPDHWSRIAEAAMTIPRFSPEIELAGIHPHEPHRKAKYSDGAGSMPLPLGEAMKIMRPSHVLVIAPRPTTYDLSTWESLLHMSSMEWWASWWESWIGLILLSTVPSATRRGTLSIDDEISRSLKRMHKVHPRVKCTALFPKRSISPFESDPMIVHNAGESGKDLMRECLEHAHMAIKRHQGESELEPAS
ncbi:hypothetical protein HZC00_04080 [Candidatus Kaiserbacteria bacterium]|nr:hypothetical protein [Candidatus Kaiserbacteria bacterium]